MIGRAKVLSVIVLLSWLATGGHTWGQDAVVETPASHAPGGSNESSHIQIARLTEVWPPRENDDLEVTPVETIPDPLEPLNRAFFDFNDAFYFAVLKPTAKGYKTVVPEEARICIRNFFNNLAFPVRVVNNLLQGRFFGAFEETCGFLVNSTVGLGGLADIAGAVGLGKHDEDFGQTLAVHSAGPGFYIHWPFLGPSSLRDTIGLVGDLFVDPLTYLGDYWYAPWSRGLNVVNETSFRIGDYESLKRAALDPYVALRDAWYQNRLSKIKE